MFERQEILTRMKGNKRAQREEEEEEEDEDEGEEDEEDEEKGRFRDFVILSKCQGLGGWKIQILRSGCGQYRFWGTGFPVELEGVRLAYPFRLPDTPVELDVGDCL